MAKNKDKKPRKCPRCRTVLPTNATEELCPACLLQQAMATQTELGDEKVGAAATPEKLPSPQDLAQYFPQLEILKCLGRGGMGVVYQARQPRLNRLIALKILAPAKAKDPAFEERFEREAQALARLNHPNIVTVHDFGEVNGLYYLMMEFVDGLSVRQLIRSGKVAPEEALSIVPKICEALQFAHDQGVVHRDIKPENILLDQHGRVKIADFGIAKILGDETPDPHLTSEKQAIGTPHYMAPEQVEKPRSVDHRADIYSLGVVFYELRTGELPLGKFAPPSQKVEVDVRLDQIVLRALEKEPEQRYQNVSEFRDEVETVSHTPQAAVSESNAPPVTPDAARPGFPDAPPSALASEREDEGRQAQIRRYALWYGFVGSLFGLPIGLVLNLPFVWGLSLLGLIVGAIKLDLPGAWHRRRGLPDRSGKAAFRAATHAGENGLAEYLRSIPKQLWLAVGAMTVMMAWRWAEPHGSLSVILNLLLLVGLLGRFKLAYVITLFFGILGCIFIGLQASNSALLLGVLTINALILISVWFSTEWFFPADDPIAVWLRGLAPIAYLLPIPSSLFVWFLMGGHAVLGIDLDSDALFLAGLLGFPLSAGVGLLLAMAIQALTKNRKPVTSGGKRDRWSWQAILGAAITVLSLPLVGGALVMWRLIRADPDWNPATWEFLISAGFLLLAGIGVLVSLALAAAALSTIARERSSLRGERIAWGIAVFWVPLCLAIVFGWSRS